MRIAIHQPNYFPYMGFFQKMEQSDLFVILECVQFEKSNYQNRFQYLNEWYTMPVENGKLKDLIHDKVYLDPHENFDKIKSKLKKSGFQSQKLDIFDECISENLAETNKKIIKQAKEILNIKTPIFTDWKTPFTGTQRLIEICKHWNADEYLSGISGRHYLDVSIFKHHGIKVIFQNKQEIDKRALIEVL